MSALKPHRAILGLFMRPSRAELTTARLARQDLDRQVADLEAEGKRQVTTSWTRKPRFKQAP